MRAAVTRGVGQGFVVMDVTIAVPVGEEVLVDVKASGLCHTDHSMMSNDFGLPLPAVFGHEVAGVVRAVGPEVTDFAVGDHVAACLVQWCGRCKQCRAGRQTDCTNPGALNRSASDGSRLSSAEGDLYQGLGVGGFAEQVLVHENQLAKINRQIPFSRAAVLGCATVTGAGAVINTAKVTAGDTVAVIGTGGVGLNAIAAARLAGASTIIAVDLVDSKLAVAKRFGATHVINSSTTDAVEEIRTITDGGVDYCFEVTGLPTVQTQAIAAARMGGTALFLGVGDPGATITIDTSLTAIADHKTITTVAMGSTDLKRDIPFYADMYVAGRFNLDDLISKEIAIDDIEQAYAEVAKGGIIRSVITTF